MASDRSPAMAREPPARHFLRAGRLRAVLRYPWCRATLERAASLRGQDQHQASSPWRIKSPCSRTPASRIIVETDGLPMVTARDVEAVRRSPGLVAPPELQIVASLEYNAREVMHWLLRPHR